MSDLWDIPGQGDRVSQMSDELGRLFPQQTEFFRKGARVKHNPNESSAYEKRHERIRALFAELSELKKAGSTSLL
jgi:hypothetical protein